MRVRGSDSFDRESFVLKDGGHLHSLHCEEDHHRVDGGDAGEEVEEDGGDARVEVAVEEGETWGGGEGGRGGGGEGGG